MPISKSDLKLVASQRMTDNPDGGGRITANEIVDGESNAIFDDVTDLDRVTGNVALRKIFPLVDTPDTDVYMGANIIITETPDDPGVNVTMFTTGDYDDERQSARSSIERFLVKSRKADYQLLGNHYVGMRTLQIFALEEKIVPIVGDVLVLENPNEAGVSQYVRIVGVVTTVETFTVQYEGRVYVFDAQVANCEISAPLDFDFPGGLPWPFGARDDDSAKDANGNQIKQAEVFRTEIADASQYFGIKALESTAEVGDVSVKVDSLFSELVPAAQGEAPLLDVYAAREVTIPAPIGDAVAVPDISFPVQPELLTSITLPRGCQPGSFKFTWGVNDYFDDGRGNITTSAGTQYLLLDETSINYSTGQLTLKFGAISGNISMKNVSYVPQAALPVRVVSEAKTVDAISRGFNYIASFIGTVPAAGTTVVSYMVFGEWYTISDDGTGNLSGAGSGTVNFATGTISVTTQEMPDVGTVVLFQFAPASNALVEQFPNKTLPSPLSLDMRLQRSIDPGSVVITYESGEETKTVTDDSEALVGDGSGTIDYETGRVNFIPSTFPNKDSIINVDYTRRAREVTEILKSEVSAGGMASGMLDPGDGLITQVYFTVRISRQRNKYRNLISQANNPTPEVYTTALYFSWTQTMDGNTNIGVRVTSLRVAR